MESATASAAHIGGITLLRLQSDERLAQLASAGSDDAFETLVRRYRGSLVRSCRRILPQDRAEDAVQQALLDAHQALLRNGSPDSLRPWLHRIAVNAALKQLRDGPETVPLAEDIDGQETPEEAHERRESLRRVVGAIHALPSRQRRALVRRELEGRSHDEIARELGLSGGAVRQLIHRARNAVRSGASALIPPAFVLRLLGAGGGTPPVAEVAAGSAGGAVAAKVAIAALVVGGVAGGIALGPPGNDRPHSADAAEARDFPGGANAQEATPLSGGAAAGRSDGSGASDRSGGSDRGADGGGSGHGGSSGPGPGSSGEDSGPGSSDGGSEGPENEFESEDEPESEEGESGGSGSSGSGSSGSGSSGSGSSGSGSSGSGSSGSDSSGSGSSGSGSSGGDEPEEPDED